MKDIPRHRTQSIERTVIHKASGKRSVEHAYAITSHTPDSASPQRLLALNRGHWCVESAHHILDTALAGDPCGLHPIASERIAGR